MEFLFQRILKDAGKVDICRFCGIVEPAGNGKGLFYGSVPLFVLFHMMKPIEQQISNLQSENPKLLDTTLTFQLILWMDLQRKLRNTPILLQAMYDFVQSKKNVVLVLV